MKKFRKLALLLVACMFVFALAGCKGNSNKIVFGTGGTGGNYYAYGNVIAQLAEENLEIDMTNKTTAGSAANLRLLSEGFLDMAIVQSDILLDAAMGTGVFEQKKVSGFRAVAGIYTESCQLIVSEKSGIETVADLKGKRVSVGETDSGVVVNAQQILTANGLTFNDIEVSNLSFADAATAMKNGEIDAFFITAGAPTGSVAELARTESIKLISLDQRTLATIESLYDYYTEVVIPAGTYVGQDEDVTTIGVKAVIVASNKLSDERVEDILGLIFDKAGDIQYAMNIDATPSIEMATEDIPIGFHPGAAKYYEKQGVTVEIGEDGKVTYGIKAGQD